MRLLFIISFILLGGASADSSPVPAGDSAVNAIPADSVLVPRVYNTARLATIRPSIDGVLDDFCWSTGVWAGDFTQWYPKEKGRPSQLTELKILYDDDNLYVAIRAHDNEPGKILPIAGRRDEQVGDCVGVCFDSYHDHRTGFEFDVTAAGQKMDLVLTNPMNPDVNWNPVWYAKTGMEDSGWVAEMQIPLNQLRFSDEENQVWGLHCWRWIDRLKEEDDWEVQEQNSPGMLYLFGHLKGLEGLRKGLHVELMPYGLGSLNTFGKERGNPFKESGRSWFGSGGLDGKVGISSNFTVDFTFNPDFGQVESDPSVMNLTAFETFYEEKRPFFLEGKSILSFAYDDVNLFYTRRIGHLSDYTPQAAGNEFVQMPGRTTIIDAVKLSGKSADGLSVGILQSFTSDAEARISGGAVERRVTVEPMTNYFVGRVQKDFNEGGTIVGGIVTAANRSIRDDYLQFLSTGAYTGGVDLLHYWNDKEYFVSAEVLGSHIKGDRAAITALQLSSARYYQRPDASGSRLDTLAESLDGTGGKVSIGKASKGYWRYSTEFLWRSPGLELNDLGYMQTADVIEQENSLSYSITEPVSLFKTFSVGVTQYNNWDFAGDYLSSNAALSLYAGFLNNWTFSSGVSYATPSLDLRILRGGFAMRMPSSFSMNFSVKSDDSRPLFFTSGLGMQSWQDDDAHLLSLQAGVNVRPMNTLSLSFNAEYSTNKDNLQYVSALEYGGSPRYILGTIVQHTLGLTFRIDWNISPELSIQYYGSPFASVGSYSEFKYVTHPRSGDYRQRFDVYAFSRQGNSILLDESGDGAADYSIPAPDFSFSQFRSNLVFRWEYMPGSQIYFVWASDVTGTGSTGTSLRESLRDLGNIFPNNTFLVKASYWVSL